MFFILLLKNNNGTKSEGRISGASGYDLCFGWKMETAYHKFYLQWQHPIYRNYAEYSGDNFANALEGTERYGNE